MRLPSHVAAALLAAAVTAASVTPASAAHAQTTLTFEGLGDATPIGNYYNGGAGGSLGVVFDTTAFATVSELAGGFGAFQAAPSGTTALFFNAPFTTFVNVTGGFSSRFSLYYAGISDAGTVQVWSGLGGTGTLLGTLALPVTASTPGSGVCTDATLPYCPFALASVAFAGTARSVVFGGAAANNQVVFDNLTFGAGAASVVPEPSTFALAAAGGLALAAAARRRRA